jgi:hypothetical protein
MLNGIALFGGTSPDFHGYAEHSRILGRGRREQRALRPGIIKEGYQPRGRDLFDHIAPHAVTEAILEVAARNATAPPISAGGRRC